MKNKTKNKKITIDNLAGMTKRGFDELGGKIDKLGERMVKGFEGVNKKFEETNNNIRILSDNNAREHEEIKLRLDNVAYRFELVELQKRVDVLEKKAGIKKG